MNGVGRTARHLAPLGVVVGLLACSSDGEGPLDPVGLEAIGDDESEQDPDDGASADGEGTDAPPDADDGAADDPSVAAAVPGTIDLAAAGTVRVEVVGDVLQLQEVEPADGWRERARQVDDEVVEVELVRDAGGQLDLEVELDDGRVQVSWTLEAAPLEQGTIVLGEAGELTVVVVDGQLVLDDLRLATGWQVTDEDADDDELELELVGGAAELEVEIALDDGELELTLDYVGGERSVTTD